MLNTNLPVILVPSAGSTMDIMKTRWQLGLPAAAVCCLEQTSGRGRYGNTWISSIGDSLMLSYPVTVDTDMVSKLPFATALAVRDFILRSCGLRCSFLWPNDIAVGHQKLSGILIEQIAANRCTIGIGVNLHQTDWSPELVARAVSLRQLGYTMTHDTLILAHSLCSNLQLRVEWSMRVSLAQVVKAWNAFSCTQGVHYRLPDGERVIAVGVDNSGYLHTKGATGDNTISSAVCVHKEWTEQNT